MNDMLHCNSAWFWNDMLHCNSAWFWHFYINWNDSSCCTPPGCNTLSEISVHSGTIPPHLTQYTVRAAFLNCRFIYSKFWNQYLLPQYKLSRSIWRTRTMYAHISVQFQTAHRCLSAAPGGLPPQELSQWRSRTISWCTVSSDNAVKWIFLSSSRPLNASYK